jgi:hypothetical protein
VFLSIAGESVWSFQALCREPVMRFRSSGVQGDGTWSEEAGRLLFLRYHVVVKCQHVVQRQGRMLFQKVVLHSQVVTWWRKLVVLAVHAGARAMYIWNCWENRLWLHDF